MPLDISSDVLEIVQRVCDKALNVAKARAASSALGPKAGMRALRGRTVKHLPDGEGIVKGREEKAQVRPVGSVQLAGLGGSPAYLHDLPPPSQPS